MCAPLEFSLKPDVISSKIKTLLFCFVIDLSLEINFLFGYPSLHGSITIAAVSLIFFLIIFSKSSLLLYLNGMTVPESPLWNR